jgi:probable rRNA maturation factor
MRRALARVAGRRRHTRLRAEILLVGDREMARLAGRFRGSPSPTDVLAFDAGGEGGLAGEIAISLDTAARQATARHLPLASELLLLAVHGLWHIGGQGDETLRDWAAMRMREFETLVQVL